MSHPVTHHNSPFKEVLKSPFLTLVKSQLETFPFWTGPFPTNLTTDSTYEVMTLRHIINTILVAVVAKQFDDRLSTFNTTHKCDRQMDK